MNPSFSTFVEMGIGEHMARNDRFLWSGARIAGTLIVLLAAVGGAAPESGPSFSCAHVTSKVNKLICGSPKVSALDRQLAMLFNNMQGQPLDRKGLRQDEDRWLGALQRECSDDACVQTRYEERIAELKDESLRVASPAAYDETLPFPAPEPLWKAARAMVGRSCTYAANVAGPVIPEFTRSVRFLPVILSGGVTVVAEKDGARFAFLTKTADDGACEIEDVVALPASAIGGRFLQCSNIDPQISGFGVRNGATQKLDAFWEVSAKQHILIRVPLGVLAIENSVRCRQPETGE
ncbi:MAG: hypothetical protein WB992_00040 [Bryobacteraceae bacterium]